MPSFTIQLIPGGYVIFLNGEPYIGQDFDPAKPFINGAGQPFGSEAIALAHAEATIVEMLKAYEPAPTTA